MNLTLTRLVLLGGSGAWRRLAGIAAGVGIGVALFLTLWGAATGLELRDARGAWRNPAAEPAVAADSATVPLTDDVVLLARDTDMFRGSAIVRIGIATTPGSTVELPGGITAPGADEYLSSPALADLIARVPKDQLADRFGRSVGVLPDSMLAGPDSLVIVEGYDETQLRETRQTVLVSDFRGTPATADGRYRTVITIGSIAVFLPVVLLVGIVTQLGAAQRAERFATLRLIGASPRTIARMAALEMAAASLVGALAGIVLAWAIRPLAAQIVINDTRFFPSDLATSPLVTAMAVVVVVLAAAVVAARRVRRAGIGPLGVTKQTHEREPRAWRLAPLLLGLATMATATAGSDLPRDAISLLLIVGFALLSVGVITIGPWLIWLLGGWCAPRMSSAAAVIAMNRIYRTPAGTFRSVSGLVLAVFMASFFAGAASAATPLATPEERAGLLPLDGMYTTLTEDADADAIRRELSGIQGVSAVVIASQPQGQLPDGDDHVIITAADAIRLGFDDVPAGDLVTFAANDFVDPRAQEAPALEPAPADADLVPAVLFVRTDGEPASLDRAQTAVVANGISALAPPTRTDLADLGTMTVVNSLATLAYLGVAIAILIAGISLAVSTAAAILDRKRVFGLMRLMGMPVRELRRIMAMEAATPLLATIALTIALGFLVAWMIITGLTDNLTMSWPDPRYFFALALSATLALAAVAAISGTIGKNTTIDSTRYE